ncbi:MAG: ABC transporter substrate-binding protein [Nostoc sp.]|uniref:ABC transporter substrate-binding protein n=1 Tax=Nostoc sp. TaxID=1180 RepID=UPI002FFC56BA
MLRVREGAIAVLTSSTSTQYSFEQQGADTSTYTYYIVDGLKTGAADKNEDGWISVDELHEYATKAVQEATLAMKPEIYTIKEGYKINLAKAPIDDPKLIYRREVDYWVRDGEIINMGRIPLTKRQKELALKPDEASAIEAEVLKPYQDYKENLQEYQKAFIEETQGKLPVTALPAAMRYILKATVLHNSGKRCSDKTRADLKRLQQALGLRDEDIALIEAPIIAENPPPPPPLRNSNFKYYIGVCIIGIIGVVVSGTVVYLFRPSPQTCAKKEQYSLNDRISLGEEILLKQKDTNLDKEAGVQAFLEGNCQLAIDKFNSYRQANPRDPETLIYLNNAKARQQAEHIKIAVSVPIGTGIDLAEEILRGVAQAQDEVNSSGGINHKLLQVAIANDDQNLGTTRKIAKALVDDKEVLGVVGPASSDVTIEAGQVFNSGELVAISPVSTSVKISNFSHYIFRTVPSDKFAAEELAKYMVTTLQKRKAAVFFNFGSAYSNSLKDEFTTAVRNNGGQVLKPEDLSKFNFNAATAMQQAIMQGAQVLMLVPDSTDSKAMDKAQKVVQENQQRSRLNVLGGDAVYSQNTLETWGKQAEGMVVAIPWNIDIKPNSNFVQNSKSLWKAPVSWRTATSYDATKAIIAALKINPTRNGLQQTLRDPSFSVDGATGKIQFLPSGDRNDNPISLVKVQQISGTDKYKFVPTQP